MSAFSKPRWHYSFKDSCCTPVPWETQDGRSLHTDCTVSLHRFFKEYPDDDTMVEWMKQYANEQAKLLVFFSNRIEGSGLPQSDTYLLLTQVLDRTPVPFDVNTTRERQEVIQHGEAYQYLCVDKVRSALTEDIIQETHRLLMRNMTFERDQSTYVTAGRYRTSPVYAGTHPFLPVVAIRDAMRDLCHRFRVNSEMGKLDENDDFEHNRQDPYSLAAQLCHDFVCIHPFEDGNGRMCRLLLNYALLHYGLPFPVALGYTVHKKAKSKYLRALRQDEKRGGHAKQMTMIVLSAVSRAWSRFEENYRLGVLQPRQSQLTTEKDGIE